MEKDRKQYENYKAVLGKNAPKNLEEFQRIKYNDIEGWEFVKLDYKRRNELIKYPELKLPNAEKATADDRKFTGYLFNAENKKGYAKGKAFTSRLGYSIENYDKLKSDIIKYANDYPVIYKGSDNYGNSYEQKIIMYGKSGRVANVVVGWKEKDGKTWMTSAYIKEVKE